MDLPAGVRNFTYAKDMAIFRTRTHWLLLALLILFLFTVPLYLANYWLSVANLIMIMIISVTGLNILTGYCGQLSLGTVRLKPNLPPLLLSQLSTPDAPVFRSSACPLWWLL